MTNSSKDVLNQLLTNSIVRVTFTKSNGETRVMNCTKSNTIIPAENAPKNIRKTNEEVAAVFDTDINDWRSFRWDSVQNWETVA